MCKSILLCVQIQEKTEKGEKDPIVTRLDAWEYARRNVNIYFTLLQFNFLRMW